jgi:hypothetical protein
MAKFPESTVEKITSKEVVSSNEKYYDEKENPEEMFVFMAD